jgi:hypothetical protein
MLYILEQRGIVPQRAEMFSSYVLREMQNTDLYVVKAASLLVE